MSQPKQNSEAEHQADLKEILEEIRRQPMGAPLELLPNPCKDCAVECGFYQDYSDALKLADEGEQLERSKRWFCHSATSRACRGNANNLGVNW